MIHQLKQDQKQFREMLKDFALLHIGQAGDAIGLTWALWVNWGMSVDWHEFTDVLEALVGEGKIERAGFGPDRQARYRKVAQ